MTWPSSATAAFARPNIGVKLLPGATLSSQNWTLASVMKVKWVRGPADRQSAPESFPGGDSVGQSRDPCNTPSPITCSTANGVASNDQTTPDGVMATSLTKAKHRTKVAYASRRDIHASDARHHPSPAIMPTVALPDTGVRYTHQDLAANM